MIAPPVYMLRRYLASKGWAEERTRAADLDLFVLSDGSDTVSIPVPRHSDVVDAAKRVHQALLTLATVEDRAVESIAAAVIAQRFDVIEASVPSNMLQRESVSLRFAETFLRRGRSLIMNTAAEGHVLPPAGRARDVRAYADACRMGHTFQGSFGFRVMSPVQLEGEANPPFVLNARSVVRRLQFGLDAIRNALALPETATLLQRYANLNAGAYDDLAEIFEASDADEVTFRFVLDPAQREREHTADTIVLRTSAAVTLRETAALLRERQAPEHAEISGRIVRLSSPFLPADLFHPEGREIDVLCETLSEKTVIVRVRLTPLDYAEAIRAHEQGREVTVAGTLAPRGRKGFSIDDPTEFTVGEEF